MRRQCQWISLKSSTFNSTSVYIVWTIDWVSTHFNYFIDHIQSNWILNYFDISMHQFVWIFVRNFIMHTRIASLTFFPTPLHFQIKFYCDRFTIHKNSLRPSISDNSFVQKPWRIYYTFFFKSNSFSTDSCNLSFSVRRKRARISLFFLFTTEMRAKMHCYSKLIMTLLWIKAMHLQNRVLIQHQHSSHKK